MTKLRIYCARIPVYDVCCYARFVCVCCFVNSIFLDPFIAFTCPSQCQNGSPERIQSGSKAFFLKLIIRISTINFLQNVLIFKIVIRLLFLFYRAQLLGSQSFSLRPVCVNKHNFHHVHSYSL